MIAQIRYFCNAPGRPRVCKWTYYLMIRQPPGSPLFPYTTLFRSQAGAPSETAGANTAVLMKMAHFTSGVVRLLFVIVTAQPPLPAARPMVPRLFPVVTQKLTAPAVGGVVHAVVALYLTESAKYASSAVTRFRRSDFIEAMYAFAFVLANFGIAMAAKMPMITTTISSSMSVKPLRFI